MAHAAAATNESGHDRNVNGGMRHVSAHSVENAPELGYLPGHAGQLAVRRVDDAVDDQQRKSNQAEPFVIQKRAGSYPNQAAEQGYVRG